MYASSTSLHRVTGGVLKDVCSVRGLGVIGFRDHDDKKMGLRSCEVAGPIHM